ncbi:collagen alpha-1(VI) chain [Lates japonicus]|uniref:Collagen alpha-1(VI) chain n=1 Tax=Lates japonicus TaxID=270547 RepID=A0AAD3RA83_LATJO|nr:collagen alpha-1(VI) chain [Lates japonicus]
MEFAIRSLTGRGTQREANKKLVLFSDGRSQAVTEAVLEKRVRGWRTPALPLTRKSPPDRLPCRVSLR